MDLTSLHNLGGLVQDSQTEASKGRPLEIPLGKIIPGDNPRSKFDPEYLKRLASSIKARRVKSPISIQPVTAEEVAASFASRGIEPPVDLEGFFKINHGECRYRASVIAGKETIPAIVDEEHDGIDALVENIQRKDLDPLDIANGIQKKVNEGWKKADIARELGFSASYVSNHLKLLDLPDPVAAMIREGKSQDVTALLQLASAYKDFPEEITEFCEAAEEPTQSQVRKFIAALNEPESTPAPVKQPVPGSAGSKDNEYSDDSSDHNDTNGGQESASSINGASGTGHSDEQDDNNNDMHIGGTELAKPPKIKITGIDVRHDGRPARLLLKLPSAHGLAWIKYEDDGYETEIEVGTIEQVVSLATD